MVFDLDPGEGATLATCAQVAFLLKFLLEANALQSFPKVSGSKGLQLYVPLNTLTTYAKTPALAQSAAIALAQRNPELEVSDMAKHLRPGRVFIDWRSPQPFALWRPVKTALPRPRLFREKGGSKSRLLANPVRHCYILATDVSHLPLSP